jgi:hypothetical protein
MKKVPFYGVLVLEMNGLRTMLGKSCLRLACRELNDIIKIEK